jgi:hypothetical protein
MLNTAVFVCSKFKPTASAVLNYSVVFSPSPTQKAPLPTYHRQPQYGFWNQRGDYLMLDKYVV